MNEMFRTAGRCKKSQRFPSFIMACVVVLVMLITASLTISHVINALKGISEISADVTVDDVSISVKIAK